MTPDEIESEIMSLLDDATDMKVGLSEDDSIYDLDFISEKLARISVYQERLSDIQMRLTRFTMEVRRVFSRKASIHRLKERELKGGQEYGKIPRAEKSLWLSTQLEKTREAAEEWKILGQLVSEVKEAVAERAATIKRLDSDIRLHTKIYEAKVAAGATSPTSFTGSSTEELTLD